MPVAWNRSLYSRHCDNCQNHEEGSLSARLRDRFGEVAMSLPNCGYQLWRSTMGNRGIARRRVNIDSMRILAPAAALSACRSQGRGLSVIYDTF